MQRFEEEGWEKVTANDTQEQKLKNMPAFTSLITKKQNLLTTAHLMPMDKHLRQKVLFLQLTDTPAWAHRSA